MDNTAKRAAADAAAHADTFAPANSEESRDGAHWRDLANKAIRGALPNVDAMFADITGRTDLRMVSPIDDAAYEWFRTGRFTLLYSAPEGTRYWAHAEPSRVDVDTIDFQLAVGVPTGTAG